MFLSLIAKTIPLKNKENQTSSHYCTFVSQLAGENQKQYTRLLFHTVFPLYLSQPVSGAAWWFACLRAGRQVSRCASRQANRMAGWTAGKQDCGQAGARAGLQVSLCLLIRFIYCTIPLLLHYYVDRRMHCATDLHHPNSTPLNPHPIADTFNLKFRCCKPVRQYNSKTVNQRIFGTMLLPFCTELLSWLSGSVYHRFCMPLVRCVCK